MPQLNPGPWLLILLMSWLVFLMMTPKPLSSKLMNETINKTNKNMFFSWHWPWT